MGIQPELITGGETMAVTKTPLRVEIGQWGGNRRKPVEVRNVSDILRLYAKLNGYHYITAPTGMATWQLEKMTRGELVVWTYGRDCWSDNVATDYATWQRCLLIAQRYRRIAAATELHRRLQNPDLTACYKCGRKTVEYQQLPYGNKWECLGSGCDYKSYHSIGD
jgi:hypothetical protein